MDKGSQLSHQQALYQEQEENDRSERVGTVKRERSKQPKKIVHFHHGLG
jgi:hypothetical protein